MKINHALLALPALVFSATLVQAQSPDPTRIYVHSISYGGSGSPQGTVGSSFSNDRESFTLIFDSFVASSGPGVSITESQKNSQLNINYRAAKVGKLAVDLRGYVNLPAGVSATVSVIAYDEKGKAKTSTETFQGPVSMDYLFSEKIHLAQTKGAVAPKNLSLVIKLAGDLQSQAQITVDSIDGAIWAAGDGNINE